MKGTNSKQHLPEESVAKLRQTDDALAKGATIVEVARSLGASERQAFRVMRRPRSTQRRPTPPNLSRDRLVARMREMAAENPRRGGR
jgi:hypothetical protein